MKRIIVILITLMLVTPLFAFSFEPFVETEQGAIAILSHTYQNGPGPDGGSSTVFDFRNQGGQELLAPFSRFAVGATIANNHRVWFTYQPLLLETDVTFQEAVQVGVQSDGLNPIEFAAGTPMKLLYSFPFYRVSYTYDVLSKYDNATLGLGIIVQIRNASIRFEALDSSAELYVSQNLGVVPALALYSEYIFPFGLTLSADIAGIYASSAFFNGADFEFTGSILDASLRASYDIGNGYSLFGVARFFGGTSSGVSQFENDSWTVSNYPFTENNIATLTASVGVKWSK